jgi:hypothetical protein
MERKIEDLSDIELKALAYDTLAQLQFFQNNLNLINAELNIRAKNAQTAPQSQMIPRHPISPMGTVETM